MRHMCGYFLINQDEDIESMLGIGQQCTESLSPTEGTAVQFFWRNWQRLVKLSAQSQRIFFSMEGSK